MQRLQILHLTEYQFAVPVTLDLHQLLLRPREGHDLRIESSRLDISPAHSIRWHRDVLDNSVATVAFMEPAQRLRIVSDVIIEHYDEAPLDFIVDERAVTFPFYYAANEQVDLAPFQELVYPDDAPVLREWMSKRGFDTRDVQTYPLLDRINRAIANEFTYLIREEPGVQSPAQTLARRSGSCRDFATLFMEACRVLGLAARFVSGYLHAPASEAGNASTHAWAEVYLPGPGWKGFDSTTGAVTGSTHIPVAVARRPDAVPPVSGRFVGPAGSLPALIVNVRVRAL